MNVRVGPTMPLRSRCACNASISSFETARSAAPAWHSMPRDCAPLSPLISRLNKKFARGQQLLVAS